MLKHPSELPRTPFNPTGYPELSQLWEAIAKNRPHDQWIGVVECSSASAYLQVNFMQPNQANLATGTRRIDVIFGSQFFEAGQAQRNIEGILEIANYLNEEQIYGDEKDQYPDHMLVILTAHLDRLPSLPEATLQRIVDGPYLNLPVTLQDEALNVA